MNETGKLFIISGPSGCGKSTVLNAVFAQRDKIFFSVSATTRPPREGEAHGVNYLFITRDEFLKMIKDEALLEYAEYVGNFYGTPIAPIREHLKNGYDVFLDVEVQGKRQVIEKMPDAVSIFLVPPSLETLSQRLRDRGTETEEKIQKRLETARAEMALADTYDHIVVNDIVERAASEIIAIMDQSKK